MRIQSITIVSQPGVSGHYVGENGIVEIKEETKQISQDGNAITVFRCYGAEGRPIAEISALCPYELKFSRHG